MGRRQFTDDQVIDIRQRLQNRESYRSVARRYSVTVGCIQKIGKGLSYRDVGGPLTRGQSRRVLKSQPSDKNPNARISYLDSVELRRRAELGESAAELAISYSLTERAIRNIVQGGAWGYSPVRINKPDSDFPDQALLEIDFKKKERLVNDSAEERALVERVFKAYRSYGYPYKRLRLNSLKGLPERILLKAAPVADNLLDAANTTGLFEINAFHPYMDHVRRITRLSAGDVFQDDELFREAIRVQIRHGRRLTPAGIRSALTEISKSSQISNFRPTAACALYRHFGATRILDFCAGWGGRMLGALAAGAHYTGIDANHRTIVSNEAALSELGTANNSSYNSDVRLIHGASEDVFAGGLLREDRFDLVFTSPPYFNLEHYAYDDKQSFIRYRTYDEWLEKFIKACLVGSKRHLVSGGIMALNVPISMANDVASIATTDVGLKQLTTIQMHLMRRRYNKGNNGGVRQEPILVFGVTNE